MILQYCIKIGKGSFVNDVMKFQGFCDCSNKILIIKSVTIEEEGVKNCSKLRNVIA